MGLYRWIATFFGIGYIGKGAGTVAALVVCVLLYFGVQLSVLTPFRLFLLIALTLLAGVISAGKVEGQWGKDSSRVVIDEVLGMLVTVLYVPLNTINLIAALILFRFFDIAKPLYIRRTEQLPGGWGVMADDLLAGIYANLLLQLGLLLL